MEQIKMTKNGISWRRYPKKRQKEFVSALAEKAAIKGVRQEAVVQTQWYQVLNYCFADYKENQSKSKSNQLSRSISTFYDSKDSLIPENGRYATHMEKLLDTDGLMFVNNITVALNLIAEFKDNVKMDKRLEQERILGQVIIYLKHIQQHIEAGNKLHLEMPNVVLAADVNQAFVINARVLYPYLDLNVDWDKYTARGFYDNLEPAAILHKLNNDQNINPYVYDINSKDFDINDVIGLAADLASTSLDKNLRKIPVNQANIRGVYDEFLRLVTQKKTKVASNQELVSMFITALTDHDSFVLKNNTAFLLQNDGKFKKYRVNGRNWYAFFSRFDTNYTADEVKSISAVGDVLLEETARRFSGEYWTPTIWANEAIKYIDKELGRDWKEKYYVWDAAAGSKNLTRDYQFEHLYASTLFEEELRLGSMYNTENVAFQYDFLNDDIDINPKNYAKSKLNKLAPGLVQALLTNKPIVFYMNPPYASSGNNVGKESKGGLADTKVNEYMHVGASSENLYSQFYYRILLLVKAFNLTHVCIAFFCKTQYMTGGSKFHGLKKAIFKEFEFKTGFLFNSGEFSDTAKDWGISFTILTSKTDKNKTQNSFPLMLKDSTSNGIEDLYIHTLYEVDSKQGLANWVREGRKKDRDNDIHENTPLFTSAFRLSKVRPKIYYPKDALGYAWFKGNMVQYGPRETGIFSADFSRQRGLPITVDNFEKCMINFAVRKTVKHSWVNDKDSFCKPIDSFFADREALADMIVYSIFNTYSYQVSLANVDYLGKTYDVKNELFWMSKNEIKKLADKNYYPTMGLEIEKAQNRYVYDWLENHKQYISHEARVVLDSAKMVVKDTFGMRKVVDEDYPEFNLMRWDAGWEQIRRLMNNTKKVDSYNKIFLPNYRKLEDKINQYIYKYGFLKQ